MSLPHLLSQTESENERHYGSSVQAEIDGCSISWYSDRRHTPALMYQNQAWAEYEYINERERETGLLRRQYRHQQQSWSHYCNLANVVFKCNFCLVLLCLIL